MKLSWQDAHFRFTPRKTCALFWAACMKGVWLALMSPRQLTPVRKPSGSSGFTGFRSANAISLNGMLFSSAAEQPGRDGFSGAGVVDALVVAQEVVPEADPVFGVFLVIR